MLGRDDAFTGRAFVAVSPVRVGSVEGFGAGPRTCVGAADTGDETRGDEGRFAGAPELGAVEVEAPFGLDPRAGGGTG